MKLPASVVKNFAQVQRNFDWLRTRVPGLLVADDLYMQVFQVTFNAAPTGLNNFSYSLPKAFPTAFLGAHATVTVASVGGDIRVPYVTSTAIGISNPSIQNLTLTVTAYGT